MAKETGSAPVRLSALIEEIEAAAYARGMVGKQLMYRNLIVE